MQTDRRGFLRSSAGGALAIAVAAYLPTGCSSDFPQADSDGVKLRSLSPREYATARAAAEALLQNVPAKPASIAARIDNEITLIGDPVRADMKTVLKLIEHMTLLSGFAASFTSLSAESRLGVLNDWRDSRFALRRAAFQAIKSFVYFYAYADDATRPITRFNGPWREHTRVAAYPVDFGPIA